MLKKRIDTPMHNYAYYWFPWKKSTKYCGREEILQYLGEAIKFAESTKLFSIFFFFFLIFFFS